MCGGLGERDWSLDFTVGVRATGEKIAREPDWRRTGGYMLVFDSGDGSEGLGAREGEHTNSRSSTKLYPPKS